MGAMAWAGVLLLWAPPSAAASPVRVVVSIRPVHALAAALLEGVGTPRLLVAGADSPHGYQLKPSERAALEAADVIFLLDPQFETFLTGALQDLPDSVRVQPLSRHPDIALLPMRGASRHADGHRHAATDYHIWLNPRYAQAMAATMAVTLSERYPAYAGRVKENLAALTQRLQALDAELETVLAPVQARPFMLFHDGLQYLEVRYGLYSAGAVTLHPEQAPSARRVQDIRETLARAGVVCAFTEPQFPSRLMETVTEGTQVRSAELDYLGSSLTEGAALYPAMMRTLAATMRQCLSAP